MCHVSANAEPLSLESFREGRRLTNESLKSDSIHCEEGSGFADYLRVNADGTVER